MCTYKIARIFIWDGWFEPVHRFDHTLHGHKDVLVDKLNEAPFILIRVTRTMNDSHLFDKGGLARLSGPQKKKLQFLTDIPLVLS